MVNPLKRRTPAISHRVPAAAGPCGEAEQGAPDQDQATYRARQVPEPYPWCLAPLLEYRKAQA
eukprot:12507080-Heterocapsa_arctica.AAC.1